MMKRILISVMLVALMTAIGACVPPRPLPDDPAIAAVRMACAGRASEVDRTACIIDQAVAALNPDICRLLGIAVDDMCLQAVFEAAEDPAICERLYLAGSQTACRNYYVDPNRAPRLIAPASPATPLTQSAEAAAVIALSPPRLGEASHSPDGRWRAELVIHDCVPVTQLATGQANAEEITLAYEQLRLVDLAGGPERLVADQLIHCGGLGAYGLAARGWSDDSRYLAFTDAREGVPDGLGDWQPPLFRYDVVTQATERIDAPSSGRIDLGRLAYVLDGDIWIKALPGGTPQRLTQDGVNEAPRWSPSGRWLAFRKLDSQVWLYSAAEGRTQAIEQGAPVNDYAWSPVGDRLAYAVGSGIVHLRILDAGTGESLALLPPSADAYPGQLAWSPDGERLAYQWTEVTRMDRATSQSAGAPPAEEAAPRAQVRQDLRVIPIDGGEPTVLASADLMREGSLVPAGWSPQGERVLFWPGPRPIDSFMPETVTLLSLPAAADETGMSTPRVEGKAIAWLLADDLAAAPAGSGAWMEDAVAMTVGQGPAWTDKRIEIAGRAITPPDQVAVEPAWSPDGTRLAYSGMPDPGDQSFEASRHLGGRRIWVVATAGDPALRQVASSPPIRQETPQWSADGGYLLFAGLDEAGRASLWLVPAAGGAASPVVERISLPGREDAHGDHVDWARSFDWFRPTP